MDIASLYKIYLQHPSVQTDTRKLKNGDIFFALKGPNFNGNAFAAQALAASAAYAVIDEKEFATDERYIVVADVLTALQDLAHFHRRQLNIPVIGITGSNGKTTTKELITAVLRQQYITYATEGNLNNHIGVPLTLLRIREDAEMAIIEMGANHLHEIEGYCRVAEPTHAIITNAGKAHLEGFGSLEGVRKGKGELYDFIRANDGTIFRNEDLPYLKEMAAGIKNQVTYGSANAQYIGRPVMSNLFLNVALLSSGTETTLSTQLVGEYNFPNVMVAAAIGLYFNISLDKIKNAIAAYNPDNSRSQWMQKGTNQIILDAYNANPTSMRAAILNFAATDLPHKYLWLGAMKEMGVEEKAEHTELVSLIRSKKWDDVILVGKEFDGIADGFRYFEDSRAAAAFVKENKPANAAILIKGSRGSKMELLLDALEN